MLTLIDFDVDLFIERLIIHKQIMCLCFFVSLIAEYNYFFFDAQVEHHTLNTKCKSETKFKNNLFCLFIRKVDN